MTKSITDLALRAMAKYVTLDRWMYYALDKGFKQEKSKNRLNCPPIHEKVPLRTPNYRDI